MKKKTKVFYKIINWKFVCLVNSLVLIICMLPIVILLEQPVNLDGQSKYVLRNNLIAMLAIILFQSGNNVFFRGLMVSAGFSALLFLVINILFYSLVTIPIIILKRTNQKIQIKVTFIVLLIFVIINFICSILILLQSASQFSSSNYIYIFYQVKFQWVYLLMFLGYIFYFFSLCLYFSFYFLKQIKI